MRLNCGRTRRRVDFFKFDNDGNNFKTRDERKRKFSQWSQTVWLLLDMWSTSSAHSINRNGTLTHSGLKVEAKDNYRLIQAARYSLNDAGWYSSESQKTLKNTRYGCNRTF